MAKIPAVVATLMLAVASPAIEPQIAAPCAISKSACPVPTPKTADYPHDMVSTVAPFDPLIIPATDVAALSLGESATVTVI
jgi:hypothetical protein